MPATIASEKVASIPVEPFNYTILNIDDVIWLWDNDPRIWNLTTWISLWRLPTEFHNSIFFLGNKISVVQIPLLCKFSIKQQDMIRVHWRVLWIWLLMWDVEVGASTWQPRYVSPVDRHRCNNRHFSVTYHSQLSRKRFNISVHKYQ